MLHSFGPSLFCMLPRTFRRVRSHWGCASLKPSYICFSERLVRATLVGSLLIKLLSIKIPGLERRLDFFFLFGILIRMKRGLGICIRKKRLPLLVVTLAHICLLSVSVGGCQFYLQSFFCEYFPRPSVLRFPFLFCSQFSLLFWLQRSKAALEDIKPPVYGKADHQNQEYPDADAVTHSLQHLTAMRIKSPTLLLWSAKT